MHHGRVLSQIATRNLLILLQLLFHPVDSIHVLPLQVLRLFCIVTYLHRYTLTVLA